MGRLHLLPIPLFLALVTACSILVTNRIPQGVPVGYVEFYAENGAKSSALRDIQIPIWQVLALLIQKVVSLAGNRRHSGDGIPAGS